MQLNHCEGVYSNYWNTLLRNLKLSPYIIFMSRSALGLLKLCFHLCYWTKTQTIFSTVRKRQIHISLMKKIKIKIKINCHTNLSNVKGYHYLFLFRKLKSIYFTWIFKHQTREMYQNTNNVYISVCKIFSYLHITI